MPWSRHEVATRHCVIDYDREIAIVAEAGERAERGLVGVGRLIADPDHETVEYAVLVTDAYQGRGLGGILADHGCEIAGHWGLRRIVAETSPANERMLAVFRNRAFVLRPADGEGVEEVEKDLPSSPAEGAPGAASAGGTTAPTCASSSSPS